MYTHIRTHTTHTHTRTHTHTLHIRITQTYCMAPNICDTIFSWILVISCVSRKYWSQKFYFSMCSYKFVVPVSKSSLLSPIGKLKFCTVPSSSIAAANQEVSKLCYPLTWLNIPPSLRTKTARLRATTGNYDILHGTCTSAALRHFKKEFAELKWSCVRGSSHVLIILRPDPLEK